MRNKKLIAMAVSAVLCMGALAGCGGAEKEAQSGAAPEKTEAASNDRMISVVSREDGSGTRGAFIELFGVQEEVDGQKMDMTTEEAAITNSTSVMMTTVAGDEGAIGYLSLGSLNDTVKAVDIDGAEATAENVVDGSYKVSRPFNVVLSEKAGEAAQDFLGYILSADGQAVVEGSGYIKASDAGAYDGAKPSGKIVVAGSSSIAPVMEKLKEAYLEVNPNAEIEVQQSDSTTGMQSAIDGICDIGMASRELKDSETEAGLEAKVIATDGIAVIVNKGNDVDNLSSEQVKAIYTGELTNWSEVE